MSNPEVTWVVIIKGRQAGRLEWEKSRYTWWRKNGGCDPFPRGTTRTGVVNFIARVALVTPKDVMLVNSFGVR